MEWSRKPFNRLVNSLLGGFFRTHRITKHLRRRAHRHEETEHWAKRAIETLVRKLARKPDALEELARAINKPQEPSRCVSMPRNGFDDSIQVMHYTAAAHAICCKLWRWPDLQSHFELRSLPCCAQPLSQATARGTICINPFHYERVDWLSDIPAIMVPPQPLAPLPAEPSVDMLAVPTDRPQNYELPLDAVDVEAPFPSPGVDIDMILNDIVVADLQSSNSSNLSESTLTSSGFHSDAGMDTADSENNQLEKSIQPLVNQSNAIRVEYEEKLNWIKVAYYEFNTRVGDIFNCTKPVLSIDGFTDPNISSNRFSLGRLTNAISNEISVRTRRAIGRGIQLHRVDKRVMLQNHGTHAVYVQSRCANALLGLHSVTVVKVLPNTGFKIFDMDFFKSILESSVQYGFEAAYQLTQFCVVRLSFAKGWGVQYQRQDASDTPCWIEAHFTAPLQWLDRILIELGSAKFPCSSVS